METLNNYNIIHNNNRIGINDNERKGLYFKNSKEKNDNFISPISPLLYKEKQNIRKEKENNGNSIIDDFSLNNRQNELNRMLSNGKIQLLGKKRKLVKGFENTQKKENENLLDKKINNSFNYCPIKKKEIRNTTNINFITSSSEIKTLKNEEKIDAVVSPKKNKIILTEDFFAEFNQKYNIKLKNKKCLSENDILFKKDRDEFSEKTDENSSKNSINVFDEENINLAFNSDEITNNSLNNIDLNNISFAQSEEESKSTENNQSERMANIKLLKDEKFIDFEKDLKDYLRRIISAKRQKKFFKNVLPESLEIVKKLFNKNNNISPNIVLPIYKNDFLELSLIIEKGGKIKRKLSLLKP